MAKREPNCWLVKSEPGEYSFDDLWAAKGRRTSWTGIRNYQARNFLREMRVGDRAIFYHSNATPPGAAGVCKVVKTAEPDPTQFDPTSKYHDPASKPSDPRWDWVTVAPVKALPFLSLDELRTIPELADSRLLARGIPQRHDFRLVFVGRPGWMVDALFRAGRPGLAGLVARLLA